MKESRTIPLVPDRSSNLIIETILENPSPVLQGLHSRLAPLLEGEGRIEVVVCDPGMMRMLNLRFRMLDRPTDVLTFDLSDHGAPPEGTIFVDGRLAPPLENLVERIIHGWLHLRGYSHHTPKKAELMEGLTAGFLAGVMK
jgi:ssRNA-specific RNase YbeY (16S rRNA maturation enzyme)